MKLLNKCCFKSSPRFWGLIQGCKAHLDQDWRIEVAGQALLRHQGGRWRVQNWAGLFKLGLRFLRS
jgi:hypothetical protein